MNHSFYSADRTTHLKIVVVALIAAIGVAGFGITARLSSDTGMVQTAGSAPVLKATKTMMITSSDTQVIR